LDTGARLTCGHCGGATLLARPSRRIAQPRSTFGSPDDVVDTGTAALAKQTERLGVAIARAVHGKSSAKAIRAAVIATGRRWNVERFADPLERAWNQGQWLGALDADFEARTNRPVRIESFAALHAPLLLAPYDRSTDPAFATRPVKDARHQFEQREAVTRPVYDAMTDAARRRAVTVAGAATKEVVRTVQREIVQQVAQGADLRDFEKRVVPRLEAAGWTPQNSSHVENVLRTNVSGAYNSGRARQMTQPAVLRLRPFWQIVTVNDGPPRQRPTHQAAHLVVLRADDPFWLTAYPPFGYQCRCRVRTLGRRQGEQLVVSGSTLHDLPDRGFTSGLSILDIPPPEMPPANDILPVPANDTIPPPPEPAVPLRKLQRLEHVAIEAGTPEAVVDETSRALVRVGIEQQPRSIPDVTLSIERSLKGEDEQADGLYYGASRRVIKVAHQPSGKLAEPLDTTWTMATAATDQTDYIGRVAVHEYGHHLHLQCEYLALGRTEPGERPDAIAKRGHKVFKLTNDVWKKVEAGKVKSPTLYAETNRVEMWAESFTAYHYERDWLKRRHPVIFKMVQAVLTEMEMPL
jgi:hypothetical protein